MNYAIYCDGSTKGNGRENAVGGWAYVLVNADHNSFILGGVGDEKGTTNQRMELTAALRALEQIDPMLVPLHDRVMVYTDSAYLHNCYSQKWYESWQRNGWRNSKKQPVANQDLWEKLIPYFTRWEFDFAKVKGHADNRTIHEVWNNKVDGLAQQAAENGGANPWW
jgi:ribonuclease HI